MAATETVEATFKTRKGAENRVLRDAQWATRDDFAPTPCTTTLATESCWVQVQRTTLSVRKNDAGTYDVVLTRQLL